MNNQYTIGDLIETLDKYPNDSTITNAEASGGSYRGYYEDFYIGYEGSCTVGDLLLYLNSVVDTYEEGYKGGEFLMTYDTDIYLASYGSCGLMVTGVAETKAGLFIVGDQYE